jgi:uncharacterized protein involved in oxidation of intracellular sulfur
MITFILNDAPYGNERPYNGLRLALSLAKSGEDVRVYLMADAVGCTVKDQRTPNGYYNISRMIQSLARRNVPVYT